MFITPVFVILKFIFMLAKQLIYPTFLCKGLATCSDSSTESAIADINSRRVPKR